MYGSVQFVGIALRRRDSGVVEEWEPADPDPFVVHHDDGTF